MSAPDDDGGPVFMTFDPDTTADDELGWLWDPDAEEWRLVAMWPPESPLDDCCLVFIEPGMDPEDYFSRDAEDYRGRPWMPVCAPAIHPGKSDLLEVRVSLPAAASIAYAFGTPADAERVRKLVIDALQPEASS